MVTNARLIQVIYVEDTVGRGVEGDPVQRREMLFTKSGKLLASRTALGDNHVFDSGWEHIDEEASS